MARSLLLLVLVSLTACGGHRRDVRRNVDRDRPDPTLATAPALEHGIGARPGVDELPLEVRTVVENLGRVYFGTDSADLTPDGRAALAENAAILLRHPDVTIEVQGHADERGTTDYNLALGHRRALTVQRVLQAHGVPTTRVRAMTFGEEVPLDGTRSESAWARNRRAEFRVTWGRGVGGSVAASGAR